MAWKKRIKFFIFLLIIGSGTLFYADLKNYFKEFIHSQLVSQIGTPVHFQGLSLSTPTLISINELSLPEKEINLKNVQVSYSLFDLFLGEFVLREIQFDHMQLGDLMESSGKVHVNWKDRTAKLVAKTAAPQAGMQADIEVEALLRNNNLLFFYNIKEPQKNLELEGFVEGPLLAWNQALKNETQTRSLHGQLYLKGKEGNQYIRSNFVLLPEKKIEFSHLLGHSPPYTVTGFLSLNPLLEFFPSKLELRHSDENLKMLVNISGQLFKPLIKIDAENGAAKGKADLVLDMIAKLGSLELDGSLEDDLKVTGKGDFFWDDNQINYRLNLKGEHQKFNVEKVQLEGMASREKVQLSTKKCRGTCMERKFSLIEPFTFLYHQNKASVTPVVFTIDSGSLIATGHISDQDISAELDIKNLPLFYESLEGALNLKIAINGPLKDPRGTISILLNKTAGTLENLRIPDISLSFMGSVQNGLLAGEGNVHGIDKNEIQFKTNLPIFRNTLDIDLYAKGDIAPIIHIFPLEKFNLSGETEIRLKIGNSYEAPLLNGTLTFNQGIYESMITGGTFQKLHGKAIITDNRLQFTELAGVDEKQGKLFMKGFVDLIPERKFPFHFKVLLEKINLLRLDFYRSNFNADLSFIGNSDKALLSGVVYANSPVLTLSDEFEEGPDTVEVTYINTLAGNKQPLYERLKEKNPWPIDLNVNLKIDNQMKIKGTNLSSIWDGAMRFTGTMKDPIVHGALTLRDGKFNFRNKEFVLSHGSINFAGDPKTQTNLYLIATLDLSDVLIEAILRGPLKNPIIAFRSNPSMSQQEILSWILFNRGLADKNVFPNKQKTHTLRELKAASSGSQDIMSKLQSTAGLDRLEIQRHGNDENAMSLQMGKYISKGVLVSLNKSINAEANKVVIEANLFRNIKVQAEVSDDQDDQLLLKWKRDY